MSDRINPFFIFRVGGQNVSTLDDPRLINFLFQELEDANFVAEVDLWDGDFKLLDDAAIQEGAACEWRYSYVDGKQSPLFKGTLTELDPNFDSGSGISVKLKAHGKATTELMRGVRQKTYKKQGSGMRTSEVVEELAALNGLRAVVEPTRELRARWVQSESDFNFIKRLSKDTVAIDAGKAGAYSLNLSADQSTLIWRPRQPHATPRRAFTYFVENADPEVINFSVRTMPYDPRNSAADSVAVNRQGETSAESYTAQNDSETSRPVAGEGKATLSLGTGKSGQIVSADPRNSDPRQTKEDFEGRAKQRFARAELEGALEADLEVLMSPEVRRGDVIQMRGVSRYSGNYLVVSNEIEISANGAVSRLELKRAGAVRSAEFAAAPQQGKKSGGQDPVEGSDAFEFSLATGE